MLCINKGEQTYFMISSGNQFVGLGPISIEMTGNPQKYRKMTRNL
jgi:hypothetical protein